MVARIVESLDPKAARRLTITTRHIRTYFIGSIMFQSFLGKLCGSGPATFSTNPALFAEAHFLLIPPYRAPADDHSTRAARI
jgi:hypothetical protein